MGCYSFKLDSKEKMISQYEKALGFNSNSVKLIDFILRKYSTQSKLNPSQFADASHELGLRLNNFSIFYETISGSHDLDLHTVLILGIYLGKGDSSEKALLLFQMLDTQTTGEIYVPDSLDLFDIIADIFVNKVRFMFKIDRQFDMYEHIDNLYAKHSLVKSKLKEEAFPNDGYIKKDVFVDFACSKFPLSSSDLRQLYQNILDSN